LVLLVGCAALSGCTSSGSPKPQPSSSVISPSTIASSSASIPVSSPAPSRTGPLTTGPGVKPGEKPPVESQFAKQHSESGALSFAAYYVRAVNWSFATTDGYLIHQISAPACNSCASLIDGQRRLRAEGGYESGGQITLTSAKLVQGTFNIKSDLVVELALHDAAATLHRPSAPPSTVGQPTNYKALLFVTWTAGRWLVVEQGAPS
jgi:Family of unknown function (DUF6318)